MTLSEFAEAVGVPPRQIRYMIAEGCLPAASTTGRGADAYSDDHLAKARRYIALHRLGMKAAAIKVLMAFDDALPILQAHGIELRVDPSVDANAIDVDAVLAEISDALRSYVSRTASGD